MLLVSFAYTRIVGVERIFHSVNPVMVRIMPTMGSSGIKGQRIISSKLKIPPIIIMMVPAMSNNNREINPMTRDTSLSRNMWNLRSREAELEAVLAEI